MTAGALLLVLVAACLHSGWNALTKRASDGLVFLWSSVAVATLVLGVPAATWLRAGVPAAAVPFLLATVALHGAYFYTLGRSYRSGEFSLVYPVARGLGVGLVPLLALPLFGERLSPLGTLGVGLVVAGIVVLQWPVPGAARRHRLSAGVGWAIATGFTIAGYSLTDKAGVARLHPVPYVTLLGAGSALVLLPAVLRRRVALAAEWRGNWRRILAAASMNLTAYLLVLFAFRLSKVGYVVAARELSIVISTAIGAVGFREGRVAARLAAAAVILAGVTCVALAR
ncbi:MAG: EamA family transporter [Candidatus Rokubacteria bacterium]|nr:EamA family transporter [Candidatus Rokubacteria bacterium]MBI3826424.1 EamA family transporter [Candidatus Rokubacteria bacterium]